MEKVNFVLLLEYGILLCVGSFSGFLFAMKTIGERSKFTEVLQHIFLAVGSSMLVAWIAYEIIKEYFHLSYGLAVSISAGVGYLGAEVSIGFLIDYLSSKLGHKNDHDSHK
ncbi:holin [Helicobacter bizzozeronii]|uniref:holin n=1 Tax=Helicobacter bizzozeronii TaxID=56877 RepID=UPI000CEE2B71|nr:holin [Helicobacter bizzozeronii]